ncbi:MAG: hypothetical protein RLZZ28_2026, partial [Bacteroidota bacterium]
QGVDGNPSTGAGGDPEMIYLSPVEQTINNITLYSATQSRINQSYINVIIKNGGVKSFTLDGVSQSTSFQAHPQESNYSYAILTVPAGSHTLYSDTGFNAIAYGFGNQESYGYNAGTNVRDFTPVATIQNPLGRIDSAVTCLNTPLQLSVPLTFEPTSVKWDFTAAPNISPSANITSIVKDSTKTLNGQTLYYYSPGKTFSFAQTNTATARDTIKLYTTSSTPDGCGSTDQVYPIPVAVNGIPVSDFSFTHAGCVADSVYLTDKTIASGNNLVKWIWDYSDGTKDTLSSSVAKPKLYGSAGTGSYDIKLKVATDIGCVSNETIKTLVLSSKPVAAYTVPAIRCVNNNIVFTDASTIQIGSIAKWSWDLANGAGLVTNTSNAAQTTQYSTYGNKDVKLLVESSTGCKSDTFRLSPQFKANPLPEVGFILPEICVTDGAATFTDSSKIADGSQAQFKWSWKIFPGNNFNAQPVFVNASVKDARVLVTKADVYKTLLKITSGDGCIDSLFQQLTVNGPTPKANFTIQNANGLCSNDSIRIVNTSTVDFGYLTRLDIVWDSTQSPIVKIPDENPYDQKAYSYKYADFQSPATISYKVKLIAFSGNSNACQNSLTQIVTLNRSPKAGFTVMPGICNEAAARQITQATFDNRVPGTFVYAGTGVNSTGLFNPQTAGVGTYPIKYTYTSDKGCIDSLTRNITVWPTPIAYWYASNPLCEKNDILFTDSSKANFSKISQWKWNYDDGTAIATRTDSIAYNRKFGTAKTYNIGLQVLTDSGCVSVSNIQAVKINPLPKPAFSLPGICLPDGKGIFTNQSTIADGSEALFSYLWKFNDPFDPSPSTLKEPVHRYSAVGPYNTQLKITSKDGCIDSLTQALASIYPQPKASFTA